MKQWTLLAAAFLACAGLVAGTSALAATPAPEKMEICHKTGSKKKVRFVKIIVSTRAVDAHTRHDGDMVLMNENASCPTVATAQSGAGGKTR